MANAKLLPQDYTKLDFVPQATPSQRQARLALARSSVAEYPDKPGLRLGLAKALLDAGEFDEAQRVLDEACARFATFEALHEERAGLLARLGDDAAALAVAAQWPDRGWAARLALRVHWRAGRLDQARSFEDAVAAAAPADFHLFECRAARARDNPGQLLALSDELLGHAPGSANALYHKVIALALLGRVEEARDLLGLDRFLWSGRLSGLGDADEASFLDGLRDEIRANPTLHRDPAGHATRQGQRTGVFPLAGDPASIRLLAAIERSIADYAEGLDEDHPFVRARPKRIALAAWALVFSAAGHQRHHIHPGGWLTGTYYVSAPPGSPRPGRLRIGGLPEWAGIAPPWPVVEIEPEPGTLVLFPSFVPHETVASGSATERISVAFDAGDRGQLFL